MMRESDKHFLMAMFTATGIILFWKGIWEGVGSLPLLENAWVSLFVGAAMLTFTGIIFSEFDPLGGLEKSVLKVLHTVHTHPKKGEFTFKYFDNIKKKHVAVNAKQIRRIEKNVVSVYEKGREMFIPVHRVRSVHRNGSTIWKL